MISIRNISKSFDDNTALSGISLDISDGELFVLIGPDGAGKTTLFRILVTLLLPDEGSIEVNGRDVVRDFKEIRKRVGYMPGTFSLYPDLTVRENLEFYARIFGTSIQEHYNLIRDIYERLEPFSNRQAARLSGGMKQKLALSCSLIHRPEILVLDEPTTGVDAASRIEFWDLLGKIKNEGITILASTAYMDEAGRGDRSGFMHRGNLLLTGRPEELVNAFPGDVYACSSDDNYDLLMTLRNDPSTASVILYGATLHYSPAERHMDVREHFADLEKTGRYGKITVKKIQPSLEDTFTWLSRAGNAGHENIIQHHG